MSRTTAENSLCILQRNDDRNEDDVDEDDEDDVGELSPPAPKLTASRCRRDVPPNFIGAIVTILLDFALIHLC